MTSSPPTKRADHNDPHHDIHESDEELRFFSQPPEADEEHTLPSGAPSSLSPTTQPTDGDHAEPLDRWQRAELARFEARRAKLQRRVIATLCGAASLLVLAVVAQHRVRAERPENVPATVAAVTATKDAVTAPKDAVTTAPEAVAAVTATPEAVAAVTARPEAVAVVAVTPEAVAAVTARPEAVAAVTATPADPADSAALIKKARDLLRAGHSREGVAAARDAVAQAPLEAEPYVLLGAGLQDLGDYGAARGVFAECIKKATHGPSATCRYFARN